MALTLPNTFMQIKHSLTPSIATRKAVTATVGSYRPRVTYRKKDIHPEFCEDDKIYCNAAMVMTTCGTQKEYVVDVWSGNHPFSLGNRSAVIVDADQVEKFRKKFRQLSEIMDTLVLKGEIVLPSKRKSAGEGGKKK